MILLELTTIDYDTTPDISDIVMSVIIIIGIPLLIALLAVFLTPYNTPKKKLMCKIAGCNWRYNFPSLPNKCICKRCHAKAKLNLESLEWEETFLFRGDLGTDEEMANRWFLKYKN